MINKKNIEHEILKHDILFDQDYSDDIKDEIKFTYIEFMYSLKNGNIFCILPCLHSQTQTFFKQNGFEITKLDEDNVKLTYAI